MGALARLWRWVSGAEAFRELTDAEVEALNLTIAGRLSRTPRPVRVLVMPRDEMDALARRFGFLSVLSPGATCQGLAFLNTVCVISRYRYLLAHEFAHVYGASEARALEVERAFA